MTIHPLFDDNTIDLTKFPIDSVLKQTMSEDMRQFHSGCMLLQSMCHGGKTEAGIYLMGLMHQCKNDLEKLIIVVDCLKFLNTRECADLLFSEMKRVKSSNTTRKYLNMVISTLSCFPLELVEGGFVKLTDDKVFSYKMRNKFKEVLETMRYD
jgi:hypothetical protein